MHHQRLIFRFFRPSFRWFLVIVMILNMDAQLVACSRRAATSQSNSAHNITKTVNQDNMKVTITVGGQVFAAFLTSSEAAKDFASLFPLTLNLSDYAGTEKVSDLSKRLSTKGSPSGCSAAVGDITYYSPWGNLAIFYRSFGHAAGLINLGHIDGDMTQFKTACEKSEATFELAD